MAIPPGSLQISYDFSDPACYPGSGSTVFDLVGSVDLAITNATFVNNGNASRFHFNGAVSYLSATGVAEIGSAFTVNFWGRYTANNATYQATFSAGRLNATGQGPLIQFNEPAYGQLTASMNFGAKGTVTAGGFSPLQWSFISYTCDGTTAKLYVNGVLIGSDAQDSTSWLSGALAMGTRVNSTGSAVVTDQYFEGDIALLEVYDAALSAGDITTLYNDTKGRFDLVASYDFSNSLCYSGSGNTVFDLSGSSNDLILTGSPSLTGTGTSKTLELLRASAQSARKSTALNGITNVPMTMNVWAKFDATTSAQAVMSYGVIAPATIPGIWSRFFNDFISFEGGVSDPVINSGIAVTNTDLFYNVIASIGTSTATLYVNGSAVGTSNHTISLPAGSQFSLSGLFGTNLYDANADIAIAEVYNVALGSTAVTDLYDSQLTRFAPVPPPYVGIAGGRQFAQGFNG